MGSLVKLTELHRAQGQLDQATAAQSSRRSEGRYERTDHYVGYAFFAFCFGRRPSLARPLVRQRELRRRYVARSARPTAHGPLVGGSKPGRAPP